MGLRTHRPIGKWPHSTRAAVLRRLRIALIATLAAIPFLALGFAFWAASPPPNGNDGTLLDYAGEALQAALLVAVIAWAIALTIFGIVRWIMTGEAPSA